MFVGQPGHRVSMLATEDDELLLLADESLELKTARVVAISAPWIHAVPCRLDPGCSGPVLDALRTGLGAAGASPVPARRVVSLAELLAEQPDDPAIALLRSAPVAVSLAVRDASGQTRLRCGGAIDASGVVLYRSQRLDGGELVESSAAGFAGVLARAMGFELDDGARAAEDFVVDATDLAAVGPGDVASVVGLPASVAAAMDGGWSWCSAELRWRRSPTAHAGSRVTWLAASGCL